MTSVEANPRLQAALVYAQLGWPVVPLHTPVDGVCDCPKRAECPSPGKHPRTEHGLDAATVEIDRVRRWWQIWPHANVAIDLARAGLVDIAPDSVEWWAEFTAAGLPPTLTFASGAGEGHQHWLYARPEHCPSYRLCQTGQFDILSAGYAVMPPSLHASGREYTWLVPSEGLPAAVPGHHAPPWAVGRLQERQRPPGRAPARDRDPNDPPVELRGGALERWHGRLYETRPDGRIDRSYSLWRIAVDLFEAGCSPAFVEQLLAERDAALGWTKFVGRRDALRRYAIIVERAGASQGPQRIRLGRGRTSSASQEAPPRSRAVEWLTAVDLDELEDEQITWYAWGLVAGGLITELDGKAKQSGKTTLALAMSRAILEGGQFLGQPTAYSAIVYLTEQSGPSFKRNLARAGLLGRSDVHILLWNRVLGWKWEQIVQAAIERAQLVGAHVLVVDTLSQFSGIRGDAENSSGSALEVMRPLQAAAASGLAVLQLRHDRKSGGEVGDSGRGSSAYAGAVDVVLHLQRLQPPQPGRERQRVLEGISRFEETPDKLLVELGDQEPLDYVAVGDPDVLRRHERRIEVLANLPVDPGEALTQAQLREVIAVGPNELVRILSDLIREQLVVRLGSGKRGDPYRYYQRSFVEDDDDD